MPATTSLAARWGLGFSDGEREAALRELETLLAATAPADRDAAARQFMCGWNHRLAFSEALNFAKWVGLPPWADHDDLEGEALAALVRAANKYDLDRRVRFSTYAVGAMRKDLTRWHRKHLRRGLSWCPGPGKGSLPVLLDIGDVDLKAREAEPPPEKLDELPRLLKRLTRRERRIIVARYGLRGPVRSTDELGAEFGTSRETVRKAQHRVIERLRELSGAAT